MHPSPAGVLDQVPRAFHRSPGRELCLGASRRSSGPIERQLEDADKERRIDDRAGRNDIAGQGQGQGNAHRRDDRPAAWQLLHVRAVETVAQRTGDTWLIVAPHVRCASYTITMKPIEGKQRYEGTFVHDFFYTGLARDLLRVLIAGGGRLGMQPGGRFCRRRRNPCDSFPYQRSASRLSSAQASRPKSRSNFAETGRAAGSNPLPDS